MIPVLSSNQIREADAYTIANEPISSLNLMERASRAFVKQFEKIAPLGKEVFVFAGVGNNGGDALAISRMLHEMGHRVAVYYVGKLEKASADFQSNYERLASLTQIVAIEDSTQIPVINSSHLVIDGLFGSGLSRPVTGLYAEVIDAINESGASVFAIDIPSGLYADRTADTEGAIIRAEHTISFQLPKLAFFQPSLNEYVGEWHVVDIGLTRSFIEGCETIYHYTSQEDIVLPKRSRFDHKGSAGRLLLVSGSKGKMGATTLSARAAMRAGCGLLFVHTPCCGLNVIQTNVPEAMVIEDEHTEVITEVRPESNIDAIAVGPGIGTGQLTQKALTDLILQSTEPLVLDADALNIVAGHPSLLDALPPGTILTPHPGEFARLVGSWTDDFDKLKKLSAFCQSYQVNVVLKGAFSAVSDTKGNIYFNPSGNPGMATAGSGDVLTGIVAALVTQGLSPFDALRSGVYLHGLAGDLAAEQVGEVSLIASDIVKHISSAMNTLSRLRIRS